MIQSIVQSYDYKKKIGKGGGGEGTTVVANPTGPAQAWLDKIKIGDDIYQTKQVPRTLDEDKVLISDPNQETGTKWENPKNLNINLSSVADDYDATKNPSNRVAYNMNDYVIYNGELYKANQQIRTVAGAFNSDMWDIVTTYDAQKTYEMGDACIYNGDPYKCTSETGATGEWDATKWTQQYPQSYSASGSSYYSGNMVEYAGDYYVANATFENQPIGAFDVTKWTETNVVANLNPFKAFTLIPANSSITTDANGYLKWTITGQMGTPIALIGGRTQPNTGAYFELCATSYAWTTGELIVKVTDNTGAPLKNTPLTAYMSGLLSLVYVSDGTITAVTQVVDE